jgi:hypothetical protein
MVLRPITTSVLADRGCQGNQIYPWNYPRPRPRRNDNPELIRHVSSCFLFAAPVIGEAKSALSEEVGLPFSSNATLC